MTIAVHFRGPTLFVTRKDTLDRVLIPDGLRTNRHPDNDVAKPHHAGLLVLRGSGGQVGRFSLRGKTITLRDRIAGPCALDPTFNDTVPVDRLTNGPNKAKHLRLIRADEPDYRERVAAEVRFEGGTVRTVDPGPRELEYHFPTTFNPDPLPKQRIPFLTTWYTDAPNARIEIGDLRGIDELIEITLEPDESAYIYNHDKPKPTEKEMIGDRIPCKPKTSLMDRDFKWLYHLLKPPNGDWGKWLNGKELPAPLTECPEPPEASGGAEALPKAPNVSTCFGGRWID
jgi:hypothetical protein